MSQNESAEKRTVEQSDELLQKSRRLIDELEFILEKVPRSQRHSAPPDDQNREQEGEPARSE
jgi:hypothetical protein